MNPIGFSPGFFASSASTRLGHEGGASFGSGFQANTGGGGGQELPAGALGPTISPVFAMLGIIFGRRRSP